MHRRWVVVRVPAVRRLRPLKQKSMAPAGVPAIIDAVRHPHDGGTKHVERVHVHETSGPTSAAAASMSGGGPACSFAA